MKTIFSLIAIVAMAGCTCKKVETFKEANDPTPLTESAAEAWDEVKSGLNGAWGTPDLVYSRSEVPQNLTESYTVRGWRGEKVSAQILLWSEDDVEGVKCKISDFKAKGATLPASIAEARFVRYTIADKVDKSCLCGRPNGHPAILQADMLDNIESFDIEGETTRPVWVTVTIPQCAKPGIYKANVKISHCGCGSVSLPLHRCVRRGP